MFYCPEWYRKNAAGSEHSLDKQLLSERRFLSFLSSINLQIHSTAVIERPFRIIDDSMTSRHICLESDEVQMITEHDIFDGVSCS